MTAPIPSGPLPSAPPPPDEPPAEPRRDNLGIAALVVGGSGVLVSALVVTGPVGALLGIVGAVLAVVGLFRARGGRPGARAASIAGVVVSVLALGVGTTTSVVLVRGLREHSEPPALAAPTPAPPPAPTPLTLPNTPPRATEKPAEITTVPVGTPINVHERGHDYVVTVSGVQPDVPAPNEYTRPRNGASFLTAQVDFAVSESVGPLPVFVSPLRFKLVYADGTTIATSISGYGLPGRQLDTLTLAAGQKTSGMIVFEVDPARLAGARIQLDDGLHTPAGYWSLG
ncbi:protein of unknown function (DUF4352) [Streptoalloteichus tenebrarius]|uniref:DUF4352 domain-containing protein n=1 Tax=Streptoalloteichus tenebrarius (strain ATCC 17920 / DSM 40477 / JCM 4838 / CBS 697.72 / NBRC 16177 / NCIMB 11028 / NRRL B-12390 / A12253. 1 / ISP 5477) TaxID=1933 RepID=A0ABT1HS36_STRSD|nr:DUF4352 domain-containing protein [Streptoalloteichus tenebrarius]MCP2258321.1 protein of unknown function (DUF4352) [Streptoalloteichus tenebrarius]BFF03485.1 hypothetical protein GCM10020241_51600 [Streptoalloteichus tenebrarius]